MSGWRIYVSLAGTDSITWTPGTQSQISIRWLYWIHPTDPTVLPAPSTDHSASPPVGPALFGNQPGTVYEELGSGKGLYRSLINYIYNENAAGELVCGGNASQFHKVLIAYEVDGPTIVNTSGNIAFPEAELTDAVVSGTLLEEANFNLIPGSPIIGNFGIWITREKNPGATFGHLVGNTSPEVTANDQTFLISGAPIAGKILNYTVEPYLLGYYPLTTLTANRSNIDIVADFGYFTTDLAVLPQIPPINQPQFYLVGVAATEFSLPGQFLPPNSTASRNHGAFRADGFEKFSFIGDQQPSVSSAPYVLIGTIAHQTEAEHIAYLILFNQALRDALYIEYRIGGATYRANLAQNVDSYFVRKSVQGMPWISELTLKLCVASLEWERVSGVTLGNYGTLL